MPSVRRLQRHKPSPAMLVALLALFVALGGVGYAATGGNFILGQPNAATTPTVLSAAIADRSLKIANTSSATGASALGLSVASGHPPLAVNSAVRVANLNADKLDGLNSTSLIQGRGSLLSNRLVFTPGPSGNFRKTLLTLPGLGHLAANCGSSVSITWVNNTGGNVDLWTDAPTGGAWTGQIATSGQEYLVASGSGSDSRGGIISLGVGNDPGARRIATVSGFGLQETPFGPCGFQAQATVWTSP